MLEKKRKCWIKKRNVGKKNESQKFFTLEPTNNRENNRVFVDRDVSKYTLDPELVGIGKNPGRGSGIMVAWGVSKLGKTPAFFLDTGAKISGQVYIDMLKSDYLPHFRALCPRDDYIFQQDNRSSHSCQATTDFFNETLPGRVPGWPARSADLNPLDYKLWNILAQRVYRTMPSSLAELKSSIIREVSNFPQDIVDSAIDEFIPRCKACVAANGGSFVYQYKRQRKLDSQKRN